GSLICTSIPILYTTRLMVPDLMVTKVAILKILGYEHHFSLFLHPLKTNPMAPACSRDTDKHQLSSMKRQVTLTGGTSHIILKIQII
ncbi:MAG: hypothetical protein ABR531_08410, partial [Bacteroidales bacterium]